MTEYEKLLKLEETYPDYGEYDILVCRRFTHAEVGDALSDYMRNGASVCKEDAPLTDTIWNRTYPVDEFNAGFKVYGVRHGEEKYIALFRHGSTWRDAEGWRYAYGDDGIFRHGLTCDALEVEKRITEDFILVR